MKEEFPGQKSKEKLIKTLRKNPVIFVKKIVKFFIFLAISIFLMVYVSQLSVFSSISNYINIAALCGVIFSLSYGFYVWVCWYYDVYILTTARIIEVRQKGLFNREVREIDLDKIQDVTYNVSGVLSTIMEVGNVKIHSASGMQVEIESVSKPGIVREVIVKLMEKKGAGKKDLSADDIAKALAERLQS